LNIIISGYNAGSYLQELSNERTKSMSQQARETRAEEIARVRSYLASQSMKRTPAQLVEAVQEAHRQFLEAAASIPLAEIRTTPRAGEWSAIDVLLHMRDMATFDALAVPAAIERGEAPSQSIRDVVGTAPPEATWDALLAELEQARQELCAAVLRADPQAHLNITWSSPDFGAMHWREWTLFARVHTLDHARQMQAIGEALRS
jgi:hypothetical protein